MHRQLWLNDPDCLMLRTSQTRLTPEQVRAWALAVGVSGGMALVSDDLALLGAEERALLDEVLDPRPRGPTPPLERATPRPALTCSTAAIPTTLQAAGHTLVGDPETGTAAPEPEPRGCGDGSPEQPVAGREHALWYLARRPTTSRTGAKAPRCSWSSCPSGSSGCWTSAPATGGCWTSC